MGRRGRLLRQPSRFPTPALLCLPRATAARAQTHARPRTPYLRRPPAPPCCARCVQDACTLCFGSGRRPKHLTLAIGESMYLALPPRGRLVPGHCQIVPMGESGAAAAAWGNTTRLLPAPLPACQPLPAPLPPSLPRARVCVSLKASCLSEQAHSP